MELNKVLYGLTHIGPDRFPLKKEEILDLLADFGLKRGSENNRANECESALYMLQLLGHIDYVIDEDGGGSYTLAPPHLRPTPEGTYVLAGARSRDIYEELSVEHERGTSWEINGTEIKQPDIAVMDKEALEGLENSIKSAFKNNPLLEEGWKLPPGNLPTWESTVLDNRGHDIESPVTRYGDEDCRIFDPHGLKWKPFKEFEDIFYHTGPMFLISYPTVRYTRFALVFKKNDDEFTEFILPSGLDNQRWGRLMVLASYGIESNIREGEDYLKVHRFAQLPMKITRRLVDITGRAPSINNLYYRFHDVDDDIQEEVNKACIKSFVKTDLYEKSTEESKS